MLDAGNEGRRAMRVHSWSEFALGAAGFSVGIALLRGNGVDGLFGVGWIAIGAVHLWRAFNKAWCARTKEQEEKQRRAARKRLGKWAWPVRLFGVGLAVLGVLFMLLPQKQLMRLALVFVLAGLWYTMAVEAWLRGWAEQEEL